MLKGYNKTKLKMVEVSERVNNSRNLPLYDFHIHSSYSDGEDDFLTIINHAVDYGLEAISVTDHNGIHPDIKQFVSKAEKCNLEILEGIEISSCISAKNNDKLSLHILGYSSDFNRDILNAGLKETVEGYENRAKKIIEKCRKLGIPLNYDKIKSSNPTQYLDRNTIAEEIVKCLGVTFKEALKIAFVEEKEDWFLDSTEVVELIKKSGGVPILAHPGKYIDKIFKKASKSVFEILVDHGLKGIEVIYPSHTNSNITTLFDYAKEYELFVTGGTDYHGLHRPPYLKIGGPDIDLRKLIQIQPIPLEEVKSTAIV